MNAKLDAKLEAMIVSQSTFGADAIQAALAAAKQKKAEEAGKVLLELLERHDSVVHNQVELLRSVRQQEREYKKMLAKMVKAREIFETKGEPHAMIFLTNNCRVTSYVNTCNNIGITPMKSEELNKLVESL